MKNKLDNLNEKAITYLANAIILLEEQGYTKEDIVDEIGISSEEYEYVMYGDFNN